MTGTEGRVLDWFAIFNGSNCRAQEAEWIRILKEIHSLPGCEAVSRACPSEAPATEWVVIKWVTADARAQFLASEQSKPLIDALGRMTGELSLITSLIKEINSGSRPDLRWFLKSTLTRSLPELYGIMTVYFPKDLPVKIINKIEMITGPFSLFSTFGIDPEEGPEFPKYLFFEQNQGWLQETVEFEGGRARCLVYMFHWTDEEGEQAYKEHKRGRPICRGRRKLTTSWEVFLDDLEQHGMLGYRSEHTWFKKKSPDELLNIWPVAMPL
ncbi:hypothetical protein BO71DRAFT_55724 [Aspergillus ellipticus CBS 707.79]|uniref:ABM domain-containing protein n=1 Tax=Aspergillus ellipticus CBS 707.79 TaxID=1448320 RepID=A0A319D9Q7_9EURO|nr:hypothetical protein BO71DRAFT_55724 [Aspergillus ellipticus CBS 707.79]